MENLSMMTNNLIVLSFFVKELKHENTYTENVS